MPKIVLIDDEQMILDLYSRALMKDYEVLTASNGKDGFELIKHEKPVLVLLDLRMPEMDGIKLLEKMKENGIVDIPVIVLTNYSHDEKIAAAIELGAKEYALKEDISPAQLIERIKNYVK